MDLDPAAWATIGAVLTALITGGFGYLATRTKVRVDDAAAVRVELADARRLLAAEIAAREADRVAYRTQADEERAAMERRHDEAVQRLENRIDDLEEQVDAKDRALTKIDRRMLAARAYIAKLLAHIVERGETPPPKPEGYDA